MSKPIRIVVADDHPVVRDGLIAMLQTQSDFEVIGEAGRWRRCIAHGRRTRARCAIARFGNAAQVDGIETLQRLGEREK